LHNRRESISDKYHIARKLSPTLVQIDPGWRDFLYFVYEDEVAIVDPHDMTIVAILPV
jgi:hypothetical protein